MDAPRPQRNRIHLDVDVPHDVAARSHRRGAGRGRPAALRFAGAGLLGAGRSRRATKPASAPGRAATDDIARLAHCDHPHVRAVLAHSARRPGRRRSAQPQTADPGGLRPPDRARPVQLAAAGPAGAAQDREDRARGDGRHRRPGDPVPGAAAQGALRDHQPLDRVRRRGVPPQGPPRQRLHARAHPRGVLHPHGEGGVLAPTRTFRCCCSKSRPSTATRPGRGRASCAGASS